MPFLLAHCFVPLVLIRQSVENESKCFSGCVHWNCKTHCHGILQTKGINRTKMRRNGHQIQLFLSQKSLKAQIARRWEDINGKCCYGTSSLCRFNFFPLCLEQVAAGICVLNFNSCVCKASGCWTFAWQSRVGEPQAMPIWGIEWFYPVPSEQLFSAATPQMTFDSGYWPWCGILKGNAGNLTGMFINISVYVYVYKHF